MRIQHNIAALNSYRNLTNNNNAVAKNLEKLSSGYRINRAGDDAAGLAISEKMRAQITGLETAQKNASDGVSLVQTAEGALTEVHSMLNRMVELANQSANGTYDNDVDRIQLQKELDQLRDEINRIADSSNFNGIKLLDGSMDANATTTVTADSAISAITTGAYAPKGASDAFSADFIIERPEARTTQQNAKFSLSLDDITISGADATDEITLKVGDATLTYKLQNTDVTGSTADGAKLAAGLAGSGYAQVAGTTDNTDGAKNGSTIDKFTGITNTSPTTGNGAYIKIDGHIWKMSNTAGSNTIDFEQVDYMGDTDAELVNPDYHVEISAADKDDTNGEATVKGTVNWQNQKTVQGQGVGTSQQAQVSVNVDFSKLKDGDRLVAGDKTYVFKVGKDSTTTAAGTGEVLVDLSAIFKEESDLADTAKQEAAMVKITGDIGAGGSTTWSAGNQGVTDGKGILTFQSLSTYDGDTVDANKVNIASNANNEICDMRTQASVMKQFFGERPESGASVSFELDVTKIKAGDTFTIDGKTFEFTDGAEASSSKNVAIDLSNLGVSGGLLNSQTGDVTTLIKDAIEDADAFQLSDGQSKYSVTVNGNKLTLSSNDNADTASIFENRTAANIELPTVTTTGKSLTLQIGDTSESFNQMKLNIGDAHVAALGIGDISITTQEDAGKAVDAIKNAINKVSDIRGSLGAVQNRLEHTINNLGVQTENITAAESRIRDVDMAKEMMAYTKNNILVQAAQAMLAQANQVPQGVLQLLQ